MESSQEATFRIELHGRAEAGLNTLTQRERTRVEAALFRLSQDGNPPSASGVYPISIADKDYFVFPATDDLRVIFSVRPGHTIFVENIVNYALAEHLFSPAV